MTATVKVLTIVMHILQKFGKIGGILYGKNGEKNPGSCI
jgi:hypothetical protein